MVLASHIVVSFPCSSFYGVAALAMKMKHARRATKYSFDAAAFLGDTSFREGAPSGPKGGMLLWGWTGNHVDADKFVDELLPFFRELISGEVDGGPCEHERVIVLFEQEQTDRATSFEIRNVDGDVGGGCEVIKRELPFSWGLD